MAKSDAPPVRFEPAAQPASGRLARLEPRMFEDEIRANKRKTVFIVAFMFLLLWAVIFAGGYMLGVPPYAGAFLGATIAGIYVLVTSRSSVKAVIAATKARPADPKVRAERLLIQRVEEMAIAAGLPPPKVYVQPSKDANAFAAGRSPETAIVAVTTGALEILDQPQLEAVIAHEMAHVLNRDVLLATITIGVVGAIAMIGEIVVRMMFFGGGRRDKNAGVLLIIGLVFLILAPIISRLVYLMMSRNREYLADATAARLTRNPSALADALTTIRDGEPKDPQGSRTVASLYISNPFKRVRKRSLFSTHPPIDERIARLREMG